MSKAERTRKGLYDAKTNSLRAKMKAIKKATRAQYGSSSAECAQVKSIKLQGSVGLRLDGVFDPLRQRTLQRRVAPAFPDNGSRRDISRPRAAGKTFPCS